MYPPLVLVAHGSRDPRAAATTRALSWAVAAARPGCDVHVAYLDHAGPRPDEVLVALEAVGHRRAVLVPLLLTAAYHGRVDVPAVVAAAKAHGGDLAVAVADVLGPEHPALTAGLVRRLAAALTPGHGAPGSSGAAALAPGRGAPGSSGAGELVPGDGGPVSPGLADRCDAVVLAAAGTRSAAARAGVERAARALGASLGVPCVAAYASAAPPEPGDAVRALQAAGAQRVAAAAYFLAPGLLYDAAMRSAADAGAVVTADPLGDVPEVVAVVLEKFDAARRTASAIAYAA